jgi:hypothetical protein
VKHVRRLAVLLGLAACAAPPPLPQAVLPGTGSGRDPAREAVMRAAFAFAVPGRLAGDPMAAAVAAMDVEYLAAELAQPWRQATLGLAPGAMQAARTELRAALGVRPGASPQAVIDGLAAVRTAIAANDPGAVEARLVDPVFAGGVRGTAVRLASLPALPRVRDATALAQYEMMTAEQWDVTALPGPDGGRG